MCCVVVVGVVVRQCVSMFLCFFVFVCVCVCVREREREREKSIEKGIDGSVCVCVWWSALVC